MLRVECLLKDIFSLPLGALEVIYLIFTLLGHSIFCLAEHKTGAMKNP